MTYIYIVSVNNRFEGTYKDHYFTDKNKAYAYVKKINDVYKAYEAAGKYGLMIYYVDERYDIKEVVANEE